MSTAAATMARWSRLRLRQSAHLRDLCAETSFTTRASDPADLRRRGLDRHASRFPDWTATRGSAIDDALDVIAADVAAGVRHFLFFAVPTRAHRLGYGAFAAPGRRRSSGAFGDALHLWVDICLCSSTDDGHCAISRAGRTDRSRGDAGALGR